jgi:3-methylcrotonyl-CoA carboxylase alpha subunit
MPSFTVAHKGETHTIRLERDGDGWIAQIADRLYRVRIEPAGDGLRLIFENEQTLAWTAADGDARFVWVDGEQVTLTVQSAGRTSRKAAVVGDKQVRAAMPGQVRAVLVAAGDAVKAGQTLVVMEAMKMEIRANAPFDGIVAGVRVQVGDVVERDAALVELA